jgi:hypothetical protein
MNTHQDYVSIWFKKIRAIEQLGGACCFCGEKRPWLLIFHHKEQNEKEFNYNFIRSFRWSIIKKEIKKCLLVCYNCHTELHHIEKVTKSQTNKRVCLDYKNIKKCRICGYDKCMEALEFHHTENKTITIGETINNTKFFKNIGDIPEKIKTELDVCEVLCSNCHHNEHFDKERFETQKPFIDTYKYKELHSTFDRQQILDLYKKGLKQVEIAKILNCAKSTICGTIKKIIKNTALNVIDSKDFEISKKGSKKRGKPARTFEESLQLILKNVDNNDKNCWIWRGHRRKKFGTIYLRNREIAVHRIIYEKFKGPIPKGLLIRHTCNNSLCCNPEHLIAITSEELGEINKKNGTVYRSIGEKSGMHKLTSEQVLKIREDPRKLLDIARDYGVVKSTVSMIKNKKSRING